MSGGYFDYKQYDIGGIADSIELLVENNDDETLNEWGEPRGRRYPQGVIIEFEKAVNILKTAAIYAQRIDWLVSGDDGEEAFAKRLKEDLEGLKSEHCGEGERMKK